jgi:hypothetical protein
MRRAPPTLAAMRARVRDAACRRSTGRSNIRRRS